MEILVRNKRYSGNICKCCLTNKHILKDLWGVNLIRGDKVVYGEMITKCFAISLQKPVDRTELICESCIKTLLIAFKFKRDVLASEQKLLELLKDETNECDEIVEEDSMDDNIIQEDLNSDEDSKNKVITVKFEHSNETVIEDIEEELKCFEVVYLENRINVEQVKVEIDVSENTSELKHPFPCALCGQNISNYSSLAQHKCALATKTPSRDVEEQGEQIAKKFTCDICKGELKYKRSLTQHMLKVHKYGKKSKKIFPCNICDKQFSLNSILASHQLVHTGDKPYSCKFCNKKFSLRCNLIRHQRVHTGEKPYLCKICNRQFACSSNLTLHQRVHSGDRPYSCKICTKQFASSSTLTRHERIHTGEKPYLCEICNRQFACGSSLIKHRRRHGHGADKSMTHPRGHSSKNLD